MADRQCAGAREEAVDEADLGCADRCVGKFAGEVGEVIRRDGDVRIGDDQQIVRAVDPRLERDTVTVGDLALSRG